MYGIVNKAIEDLVRHNFGDDKWEEIKARSGIDVDYFISNEPYDDAITYSLAIAASEVTGLTVSEVLVAFGRWWVLRTGREKYHGLLEAGGENLRTFLKNLPVFHTRIMLLYPKLTPPEFKVVEEGDATMLVHYYSKRVGLQDFVRGLLTGLGEMYETPIAIDLRDSRDAGHDHEVFAVTML